MQNKGWFKDWREEGEETERAKVFNHGFPGIVWGIQTARSQGD